MGKSRRDRDVRAYQAATGKPYHRALREYPVAREHAHLRTAWLQSAWPRLLPVQAFALETAIGTATALGRPGSLADAFAANHAEREMAEGPATPLSWNDEHEDPETALLAARAREAFNYALDRRGATHPATLGDLALLLAEIGLYDRVEGDDGGERWSAPETVPDPDERRRRWRPRRARPAP